MSSEDEDFKANLCDWARTSPIFGAPQFTLTKTIGTDTMPLYLVECKIVPKDTKSVFFPLLQIGEGESIEDAENMAAYRMLQVVHIYA